MSVPLSLLSWCCSNLILFPNLRDLLVFIFLIGQYMALGVNSVLLINCYSGLQLRQYWLMQTNYQLYFV